MINYVISSITSSLTQECRATSHPPRSTLPCGTELHVKSGRDCANGDSWLTVGKLGGAGVDKTSWVPSVRPDHALKTSSTLGPCNPS